MSAIKRVRVIDSHTGGEPTRVVLDGGPDGDARTPADVRRELRERYDWFRQAVTCEPRGSDVLVSALLLPPTEPKHTAGVVFFNNVGYLGMCGHGTIGLVATLHFLGRIAPGRHLIETPVGIIEAWLQDDGAVSVRNVPAYRYAKKVRVAVEGFAPVTGDVAWGGNWFFLTEDHSQVLEAERVGALTQYAESLKAALARNGITGQDGAEIDHIELVTPSPVPNVHARNFVLCPGGAYDRSPCGTGTSAKLACLAADGKLKAGETWRQESIIGSVFEGTFEPSPDATASEVFLVIPTITGRAYVTGEATLLLNLDDPFCWGIGNALQPGSPAQ